MSLSQIVVGVDVGGAKKGFHAVALRGGKFFGKLATADAAAVVTWCRSLNALAVGVDAPCKWSLNGHARPCERALAFAGFSTFATPSAALGERHPFYGWMVNGIELYRLLNPRFRLYDEQSSAATPVCFETFPQAIACALAGKMLSAKNKRIERPRLLQQAGISLDSTAGIDTVDAALCALTAHHFLMDQYHTYGEAEEGFIIVPSSISLFSITRGPASISSASPASGLSQPPIPL
jgi:predicted nuclease with RNAse H fold